MSYAHWLSFFLSSVTRVDEDGERVRIRPKDWCPEYMIDVRDTFQKIQAYETRIQTSWPKGYN
jgi:hypothetical protein